MHTRGSIRSRVEVKGLVFRGFSERKSVFLLEREANVTIIIQTHDAFLSFLGFSSLSLRLHAGDGVICHRQ